MKKLILISLFGLGMMVSVAQVNLDSLWGVWGDERQADSSRLEALDWIIHKGYRSQPDSAAYYLQLLYDFAEAVSNKKWMAEALNEQGYMFQRKGDIENAKNHYLKSLKLREELGNKKDIAGSLINLGNVYMRQGDYPETIDHFIRGEKICNEIGEKKFLKNALLGLGTVYLRLGDNPQALKYWNRSLKISEEIGNKAGIAGSLINIGNIYNDQGDYAQALDHYTRGEKICKEIGNKSYQANAINNIGSVYRNQGIYDKALDYFFRSLKIREEMKPQPKLQIARSLSEIGDMYRAQGSYDKAISYGIRSLDFAQEGQNLGIISIISRNLSNTYKAAGQYKKAMEMQTLFYQVRDSIMSEKNQKAAIQQQVQAEYEKQKALDDLENEKQLALERQKKENQQKLSIAIGIGLLLVILLALGLWSRNRFIKRTNHQLEIAKTRAEQSEAVKEQFLANMSHEIRTPMHAISGMIKILERKKHYHAQEIFLDAMHKSSDNLIVLLNDILDLSKIEAGKLDVEIIPTQPTEVLGTVEQILQYKAEEKSLSFAVEIDKSVPDWIMGDPTRINQILTNLAGNAIKFTEKGSVSISLSKKNDFLLYEVRDTGVGIPEDKLLSIFDAFEQAEGSTTRRFGGTGLGLSISRQLVELMGGNIWAEWEQANGKSPIPIIAMTASLLKSEVNLCLEAGMDNYIPKPYEAEELVGTIASQLL